jgi:hypothetical protein
MIEKSRRTITDFLTGGAGRFFDGETFNLLATMLPNIMKNPVCLCEGLVGAAGAFECGCIVLGVLGGDMDCQSLGVQKLLFTERAAKGKVPLMLLHMVVHGILVLLDLGTDRADKLAGGILLIDVRHLYRSIRDRPASIFCGTSRGILCLLNTRAG